MEKQLKILEEESTDLQNRLTMRHREVEQCRDKLATALHAGLRNIYTDSDARMLHDITQEDVSEISKDIATTGPPSISDLSLSSTNFSEFSPRNDKYSSGYASASSSASMTPWNSDKSGGAIPKKKPQTTGDDGDGFYRAVPRTIVNMNSLTTEC